LLWGQAGAVGAAGPPATAPLQTIFFNTSLVQGYYEATVISIGGGPSLQVIVDTGSTGLIVPPQDVNLATLGPPTGSGTATYGNGTYYVAYTTYTASVNFGNGIITAPTTVGVVTSVDGGPASQAVPIMGVGANTGFPSQPPQPPVPFSTSPLQALPGNLGQGVLLNNPGGVLEFGPNPLTPYASVSGAPSPTTPLGITITPPDRTPSPPYGGPPGSGTTYPGGALFDSGGFTGQVPADLLPQNQAGFNEVLPGDVISVYTNGTDQTLLYQYTVSREYAVAVVGNDQLFSSGIFPFSGLSGPDGGLVGPGGTPAPNGIPIYLSYGPSGTGTTYFDT
jgi:hypothetical protein